VDLDLRRHGGGIVDAPAARRRVMLDAWHWFRRRAAPSIPPRASAVSAASAPDDPIEETLHRRLAPGDGDADLAGLLRHLAAGGCAAPIGVEVFSDTVAVQPVRETARQMARAARRILGAVR
jgi:sugar phosphate isomerase/epimerase